MQSSKTILYCICKKVGKREYRLIFVSFYIEKYRKLEKKPKKQKQKQSGLKFRNRQERVN